MIAGVVSDLSWTGTHALLWTPSTIGSIGFVVSSWIAWREARPAQDIGTAASVANLVGSAGFLVGSLTGFFDDFGLPANDIANPVFLAGSLASAIGSLLAFAEHKMPTKTSNAVGSDPAYPGSFVEG